VRDDLIPLRAELATWRAEGRALPLWWRDDDAVSPSAALESMVALAERLALPVHLAVIPRDATRALATFCVNEPRIVPMVHGWAHRNHATEGRKKAEFGEPREGAEDQTAAALTRMRDLFGDRLLPVFVPPWNRIDPSVIAALPAQGYAGLSTYLPRTARWAAPGLVQINTHIDPIHWRAGGGLVPPGTQIAALVAHLRDRRAGRADAAEPLGILTHHLVQDTATWDFTAALAATLLEGGAHPISLNDTGDLP
jgi:hypothetical protein